MLSILKKIVFSFRGRGDPIGKNRDFFNHNHHRYFNGNTLELMRLNMDDTLTTQYPIYGPSRLPGFSAHRFSQKPSMKSFKKIISNGKKETIKCKI